MAVVGCAGVQGVCRQVLPGQPGKSFACGLYAAVCTRLCVWTCKGTRVFICAHAWMDGEDAHTLHARGEEVVISACSLLGGTEAHT